MSKGCLGTPTGRSDYPRQGAQLMKPIMRGAFTPPEPTQSSVSSVTLERDNNTGQWTLKDGDRETVRRLLNDLGLREGLLVYKSLIRIA